MKTKTEGWKRFCESLEKTPETARLQKLLSKERRVEEGTLELPTGGFSTIPREAIEHLIDTHFPGANRTQSGTDWGTAKEVVTPDRVCWAVNTFSPYKAPGLDGIYPVSLQTGLETIMGPFIRVRRASVALEHIPKSWSGVRVVFLPKLGRDPYKAKSYRPISLS